MAQVTWARHGTGYIYAFDGTCSSLVTYFSKSALCQVDRQRAASPPTLIGTRCCSSFMAWLRCRTI